MTMDSFMIIKRKQNLSKLKVKRDIHTVIKGYMQKHVANNILK